MAATLAGAWAREGWEVTVIPTFLGVAPVHYSLDQGVALRPLRDEMATSSCGLLPRSVLKLWVLRRMVRRLSPDVIVSFLTNVNVTAIVALRGMGIPLIVSERIDPAGRIECSWILRAAQRLLYQFADSVVVQTRTAEAAYRKILIRAPRMVVIPNPLPRRLHESSVRSVAETHGGQIVSMGRLTSQKGFDHLIRAFGLALRDCPEWTLGIWGEGPLRSELEALVEAEGLGARVQFCGRTTDPWRELAKAQIFVLSSQYEGFPNVMMEAMALGVPCVAYDCPSGPRDLADGGCALLVPSGDVRALAETVSLLAGNSQRRHALGSHGAVTVRERFSESAVMQRWRALIAAVRSCNLEPGV